LVLLCDLVAATFPEAQPEAASLTSGRVLHLTLPHPLPPGAAPPAESASRAAVLYGAIVRRQQRDADATPEPPPAAPAPPRPDPPTPPAPRPPRGPTSPRRSGSSSTPPPRRPRGRSACRTFSPPCARSSSGPATRNSRGRVGRRATARTSRTGSTTTPPTPRPGPSAPSP